ncbi:hypothetical protein [Coraliomargarita parva]|uniref:hypothetical protein n=1 Tax=Coraliomargarita parva TaxID=3014050 RepID=UPI0022B3041E|nr:hypothetical protein [Coraliomargarita parva]
MILGHPGHELRAYEWMARNRPIVHVLTDGSGSLSEGRIESTGKVVRAAGGTPGAVFGGLKDAAFYEDLLSGQTERLLKLMKRIYDAISLGQAPGELIVVGDGLEGYNTAHDIMRYMINMICERLRRNAWKVFNFAFNLVDSPAEALQQAGPDDCVIHLDDAAFQRKLKAAVNYPELKDEVEMAIARAGEAAFRVEVLSRVPDASPAIVAPEAPIYYEEYGRKRVAEGKYRELILFETHVKPFAGKLRDAFLQLDEA